MLEISEWNGRFGNNLLQIIRALQIALIDEHNIIIVKKHDIFRAHYLKILGKNTGLRNPAFIKDTFFYTSHTDFEPKEMRDIFKKYLSNILQFEIPKEVNKDIDLCIHIRGGDVFSQNPHSAYLQPPLSYYKDIIKETSAKNVLIISEDKRNPCVNELLKLDNVSFQSSRLEEDLKTLLCCKNLVIGFGTFGFALYIISNFLENLYIPKYVVEELPKGNYEIDGIKLNVIDLPGYYDKNWRNSPEQIEKMLTY